jgi:hypothetical protein
VCIPRSLLNEWTLSLIGIIYDSPSKAQRDTLKAIGDKMLAIYHSSAIDGKGAGVGKLA